MAIERSCYPRLIIVINGPAEDGTSDMARGPFGCSGTEPQPRPFDISARYGDSEGVGLDGVHSSDGELLMSCNLHPDHHDSLEGW